MDQSTEHVREVSNTLYKYHLDNFLCDVFIVMPDGSEIQAHSVVLSAVSVKLRGAFEKSDNALKKNYAFRLFMPDCDVTTVEMVLQFVYTGTIAFQNDSPIDITKTLSAGQRLGLDANKLASFLGALLSLADASVMENLPPVILTDEDICLEIIERGVDVKSVLAAKLSAKMAAKSCGIGPSSTSTDPNLLLRNSKNQKQSIRKTSSRYVAIAPKPGSKSNASESQTSDHRYNKGRRAEQNIGPSPQTQIVDASLLVLPTVSVAAQSSTEGCSPAQQPVPQTILRVTSGGIASLVFPVPKFCAPSVDAFYSAASHVDDPVEKLNVFSREPRPPLRRKGPIEKPVLTCEECGEMFHRKRPFVRHQRSHQGKTTYTCDICQKSYSHVTDLKYHRLKHPEATDREFFYVCDLCDARFNRPINIVKHRRCHFYTNAHKCEVCGAEFTKSTEFIAHQRLHKGENPCPLCGRKFRRLVSMRQHIDSAHSGLKRYKCKTCGKRFAYPNGLNRHQKRHKSLQERRNYMCAQCGKCYMWPSVLRIHERKAHPGVASDSERRDAGVAGGDVLLELEQYTVEQAEITGVAAKSPRKKKSVCGPKSSASRESSAFVCEQCGKVFRRHFGFAIHCRTHARPRKPRQTPVSTSTRKPSHDRTSNYNVHLRRFICEQCGKQCISRSGLTYHRLTHVQNVRYVCHICSKGFVRKMLYDDHMSVHAGENYCPICGKEFTSRRGVQEHVSHKHGQKRYSCPICAKVFSTTCGLRYHKRIHSADRPFKCGFCGHGFIRNPDLVRHERVAHRALNAGIVQVAVYEGIGVETELPIGADFVVDSINPMDGGLNVELFEHT